MTDSDSQLVAQCEEQLELAGDHTILCGIGERSCTSHLLERQTFRQITLVEDMGFDGWVIYFLCDEVIERLLDNDPGD